jgi:hypothetical protein
MELQWSAYELDGVDVLRLAGRLWAETVLTVEPEVAQRLSSPGSGRVPTSCA